MRYLLLVVLLLLSFSYTYSQSRQILFIDSQQNATLHFGGPLLDDSLHVMNVAYSVGAWDMCLYVKTDLEGNVIWKTRTIGGPVSKMTRAANGDYLAARGGLIAATRMTSTGNVVFDVSGAFSYNSNFSLTGLAELANGDIVVSGQNFFSSWAPQREGWITILQPNGTNKISKRYVQPGGFGDFFFTAMAADSNTIYVAGHTKHRAQGFIMVIDSAGNVMKTRYFNNTVSSTGDTLTHYNFDDIKVVNGKIMLTGIYREKDSANFATHVSVYDVTNDTLSGRLYWLPVLGSVGTYIKDTNEYYMVTTPALGKLIFTRTVNDTLLYARILTSDSSIIASGITGIGDSIVITGRTKNFGYYNFYHPDSVKDECRAIDTTLKASSYSIQLIPGVVAEVHNANGFVSSSFSGYQDTSLIFRQLCPKPPPDTNTTQIPLAHAASHHDISVYPNPAHNNFTVMNPGRSMDFNLYGAVGALYRQGKLQRGPNIIDISSLPPGVYYLRIGGSTAKNHIKILKE